MKKKRKDKRSQANYVSDKKSNLSESGTQILLKSLPLLPLLVVVGIVPLVVFLKYTPVPPNYRQFWVTNHVFDFFSFYKAQIILTCAGLLLLVALVLHYFNRLPQRKSALFIPLAIYVGLVVASTVASEHPSIALGGFFERSEGMWVLLAYVVLLVGTYLFVNEAKHTWLILGAWAAALSVICVVGIFQFFGLDFFNSPDGRRLILPTQYQYMAPVLSFKFPLHSIYATLYNPNNVASMMAMAFPVAATCFVLARSVQHQVVFGALAGLFCLTLVGANGRAGWVAVLLSLFLLSALSLRKGFVGWWKRMVILALMAALAFGVLNYFSGDTLGMQAIGLLAEGKEKLEHGVNQSALGQTPETQEGRAEQFIRKYGTVGSGRVYIWIRSLQMAGVTCLLGRGPDTFALYFPNRDPYKAFYNKPHVFIDKPHNMYLQLWLNLGGIATLAFLAMVIMHNGRTLRILKRVSPASDLYVLALGLYVGWVGYLLAGFFYDSAVSVAPAFWVLFGLSMAMNEAIETANP